MNPTTKRVLMNHIKDKERRNGDYDRYDGRDGRYEPEDKFRDRRGREHYDNGRYAPMDLGYSDGGDRYYPDMRRDSRGRYTTPRSEYDGDGRWPDPRYPDGPYIPPVYHERQRGRRENYRPMNKIGFSIDGEMERRPDEAHNNYRSDASYRTEDEMARRKGSRSSGYGESDGYAPLTKEMAMDWAEQMENVDGTHGPHWSMDQVKKVMAQRNIECDPLAYYLALNIMFSDYSKVAKELGVNTLDFYAKMAKAFLDDPDGPGPEEKLARYYEYVVK